MDHQVVKVTELTPQLDMEVLNIASAAGLEGRMLPGSELFVRFDKHGRVQGAACGNSFGESCLIYLVAVREESRGMGTGSALVNHLLMYYSQRCKEAYILVDNAKGFFERLANAGGGEVSVHKGQMIESILLAILGEPAKGETRR